MKRQWLVLSVVMLSLVVALPASTQTMSVLGNGNFDVDVSGWTAVAGTLDRTTTDPHSGAGAAQVTALGVDGGFGWVDSDCIDLSGDLDTWPVALDGLKYLTLDGYLKSDGSAFVALEMAFYTETNCTNQVGESKTSTETTNSNWTSISVTENITDTASSVRATFWGYTDPIADTTFYADDLQMFSSASVNAVQVQGVTARGGLWSAIAVGVVLVGVVLARRRKAV